MDDAVVAVVQDVVKGKHGRYAVATSEAVEGSITFSLKRPVWKHPDWPERGAVVVLSRLRKKRAGWRALRARFLRLGENKETRS